MILTKIEKELQRFKKRLFYSSKAHKQLAKAQYQLNNIPYELYDKITNHNFSVPIPKIATVDQTLDRLIQDKCSLSRFGDGEFVLMEGGRIKYQPRCPQLATRLKEVIASDNPKLLIALAPCFGALLNYLPPVADFWIKCMSRKREMMYSYLDMEKVYYDAFVSRVYMQAIKTDEHYKRCSEFYEKVKNIWAGRDIVICEGEGTRFGMFNSLLDNAKSISRILCPPRNAFEKFDEILSAFDDISTDKLILVALGPTATVMAHDLTVKGYQAIDIGALDIDYEWFLRKEEGLGVPIEFKYVDSGKKGRKVQPLDNPEYTRQIIKQIT